jgi:hypothetical protein
LKAVIVERIKVTIARQRCGKQVSTATDMHTTIEKSSEAMFSMRPVLMIYSKDEPEKSYKRLKLRGGQAYDHSSD